MQTMTEIKIFSLLGKDHNISMKHSLKTNVESFELDHTRVKTPYVRLTGIMQGDKGDLIL